MTLPDRRLPDQPRLDGGGPVQAVGCLKPLVRALGVALVIGAFGACVGFFFQYWAEASAGHGSTYARLGAAIFNTLRAAIASAITGGAIGLYVRRSDVARLWRSTRRPEGKRRAIVRRAVPVGGALLLFLVLTGMEGVVAWRLIWRVASGEWVNWIVVWLVLSGKC
jgi:hypothetical protein